MESPALSTLPMRLVAAADAADRRLAGLELDVSNCVLSFCVVSFREFGLDVARAVGAWTGDAEGRSTVRATPRTPLEAAEVHAFFIHHLRDHLWKPATIDIPHAVEDAFAPFDALLGDIPADACWFRLDVPGHSATGVLWDIDFVDFAAAFDGQVLCVHLGYSD